MLLAVPSSALHVPCQVADRSKATAAMCGMSWQGTRGIWQFSVLPNGKMNFLQLERDKGLYALSYPNSTGQHGWAASIVYYITSLC